MKYIFNIIITMSLFSFSCNKSKSEVEVYAYRTTKFNNKSDALKYSFDDALNILYKYAFYELGKDSVEFYANVLYNSNYVFGYLPYNIKGTVSSLDGIWVNGNTGEVKTVDEGKSVNLEQTKITSPMFFRCFRMTKEEFENSKDTEN